MLAHRLLGWPVEVTWPASSETIVFELRLPRVLTAMAVGVALSLAGATFQGLLRNPLADPYVLGTASGAALGAAIALLLPIQVALLGFGLLHLFAFIGALAAVAVVYRVSRLGALNSLTSVLLTGYAVGSLLAAGLAMTMYLSGSNLRQIFFYLLGCFSLASWQQVAIGAADHRPRLDGDPARVPGRSTDCCWAKRPPRTLVSTCAGSGWCCLPRRRWSTAAAVAMSGLIGFVGLVVPHLVRLVVGPKRALVAAALGDLRRGVPGSDRSRRTHAGRAAGGRRHSRHRRSVLPVPAAPLPDRVRAVSGSALETPRTWLSTTARRRVLDAINVRIAAGELVALLGPNGAGQVDPAALHLGLAGRVAGGAVLIDDVPLDRIRAAGPRPPRGGRARPDARLLCAACRGARRARAVAARASAARAAQRGIGPQSKRPSSASESVICAGATCASCRLASASWRAGDGRGAGAAAAAAGRADGPSRPAPPSRGHGAAARPLDTRWSHDRRGAPRSSLWPATSSRRLLLLDQGRLVADGPPSAVLTPDRFQAVYGVDPRLISSALPAVT